MTALSETKRYQAYPEYKESEVQWLESIPSHWLEGRIKHISTNLDFRRIPLSAEERGNRQGEYPYYGASGVIDRVDGYLFDEDTILFGEDGANLLAKSTPLAFIASGKYWVNNHAHILKPLDEMYSFWVNSLNNLDISPAVSGSAQPKLTAEALGNLEIVYPPSIKERQTIANFLDHETAKIDTLIEKQQQLIKLLKEKRQAVISHAVTKGLNPQAPMKDSGVEWLGEVPEHWDRIKLKHITNQIVDAEHKTAPYFDDGEYLVCRTTNVRDGKLRIEGGKYTDSTTYEEWTKRGKPEIGDILFTREAPAGEACVYTGEVPLCLGQRMVLFKLDKTRVSPEFVLHSIYSGLADDFVKQLSQGSTVAHFNMADIQNIPLFEPSLDEQAQIVEYLSKVLAKYDALTSSAFKTIALMQERRTALISAAVTGKIDVRNWQAPPTTCGMRY
ncbi:restriction endonuclease subunit S [Vibrio fluvialis]|nr:restriction endonuclease subunit S [Vibrio fluvialis]